jgi:hypothetical protein
MRSVIEHKRKTTVSSSVGTLGNKRERYPAYLAPPQGGLRPGPTEVMASPPHPSFLAPPLSVYGCPVSGSISQKCGSGASYNQAKIVRKTLIPTVL